MTLSLMTSLGGAALAMKLKTMARPISRPLSFESGRITHLNQPFGSYLT